MSVTVAGVAPRSPARRAGIKPGDVLTHIGGHPIRDVLDYRFYITDPSPVLKLVRGKQQILVSIKKDEYQDPGLEFETFLMDSQKSCKNSCIFCFIDQNPPGMRQSIYFKDDDDRLSFLWGNYITLTNLDDGDIDRIIKMRLSPVNVSVHATDAALRSRILRNRNAGNIMQRLDRLAEGGISINAQLVLCPGINDKAQLEKTLNDLQRLFPAVLSIACVPVGLTGHRRGLSELRSFTREEAGEVIDIVRGFASSWLSRWGHRIVYASDEFYIKAGRSFPPIAEYEDFPQLENGVGMSALLKDQFEKAAKRCRPAGRCRSISLATGEAAYPLIKRLCDCAMAADPALDAKVFSVKNYFFGGDVTVCGLLTGRDLEEGLLGKDLGQCLLLPSSMLRHEGDLFLDDTSPGELAGKLDVDIRVIKVCGRALAKALIEGRYS